MDLPWPTGGRAKPVLRSQGKLVQYFRFPTSAAAVILTNERPAFGHVTSVDQSEAMKQPESASKKFWSQAKIFIQTFTTGRNFSRSFSRPHLWLFFHNHIQKLFFLAFHFFYLHSFFKDSLKTRKSNKHSSIVCIFIFDW